MRLVNRAGGLIIAGSDTAALVIDTGANTITNAGRIESFTSMQIKSPVQNVGELVADGTTGGNLIVNGAVTGGGTVRIAGATADFTSAFTENVTFFSPGIGLPVSGTLELANSQTYHGTISGFSKTGGTFLDLGDIAAGAKTKVSYSGTASGGTLTATDGTHTAHIKLAGDYTASTWVFMSDGHGGLLIHDPTKTGAGIAPLPALVGPGHGFIAAMAAFGAGAAPTAANVETWRETVAALAAPRVHLA
jgi:hypothetical protein